uniref:Iron-sulfur cluster assembly enzyme a n=1 Tax=Hucho hucho TaxID=62062 RepID=A0A4W5M9G6_9TELE
RYALITKGSSLPDVYSKCSMNAKVVDHYENPRNVGSFYKNAKNVGTGLVGAPACGDVMKLQIQVDEKGKIVDARFKTFWLWLMGKGQIDQPKFTLKIKNTDIAKELSLPPVKLHCSSQSNKPSLSGFLPLRQQLGRTPVSL